ncbi:TPA: hypothetical protein ACLKPB_000127 [Klebsiella pneumoniae]|jgi:hypothetical protein|nr:hypothetical protein [Klebsiella pneumoniae]MCF2453610.1 hypothetical protein [Klebsiella pneumoniae]MCQ8550472.1 hypothetical protein [Klebsiella pneumoniae]
MWGITDRRKIPDLLTNHYIKATKEKEKGYKSAANDDLSGADARYKQQQAQRAAAAKQAHG